MGSTPGWGSHKPCGATTTTTTTTTKTPKNKKDDDSHITVNQKTIKIKHFVKHKARFTPPPFFLIFAQKNTISMLEQKGRNYILVCFLWRDSSKKTELSHLCAKMPERCHPLLGGMTLEAVLILNHICEFGSFWITRLEIIPVGESKFFWRDWTPRAGNSWKERAEHISAPFHSGCDPRQGGSSTFPGNIDWLCWIWWTALKGLEPKGP